MTGSKPYKHRPRHSHHNYLSSRFRSIHNEGPRCFTKLHDTSAYVFLLLDKTLGIFPCATVSLVYHKRICQELVRQQKHMTEASNTQHSRSMRSSKQQSEYWTSRCHHGAHARVHAVRTKPDGTKQRNFQLLSRR